jgi:HK97 family phage prohead protease
MAMHRREAAGKRAGELSFVLSDATRDRMGDIIEPAGWQLDWFRRNPIALFGHNSGFPIGRWQNVRIEGDRLVADLEPAAAGTSARIDEIVSLVRQDILPATSVGFRPIRQEPIDPEAPHRGTRFLETELLEASIVSVPANPAALQLARSLHISDDTIRLAFGELPVTTPSGTRRGELADPLTRTAPRAPPKATRMNISQQIESTQGRLNGARDRLTEYLGEDSQDPAQRDAMSGEIEAITAELRSLENAERALAPRGPEQQAAATSNLPVRSPGRRPLWAQPKNHDDDATPFWRACAAKLIAYDQHKAIDDVLREHYPDDEATWILTRAAPAGASTTLATWALELVQTANAAMLTPRDAARILPRLAAGGTSLSFGPQAGVIKIPSEAATPNIAGSFVGEAQPIPVRRMGFTTVSLYPHKVGVITRYSREIAQYSTPSIEGLVRSAIVRKTGLMLDTLLIDAVAGGGSGSTRPAGLLNGVSGLTATAGGGYGAILGDLKKLAGPFYTANAGENLYLLINPAQALDLAMTPGPGNAGFGWAAQFTNRMTIIESTVVTAGTVIMIDASDFVSVMGIPEFDVSEEATLHIEDTAPTHINPGTAASPVESMFQTNQLALRLLLTTTWAMRRTGMVQYLTGASWAPA